jgi:DivIVA domain-containing protein
MTQSPSDGRHQEINSAAHIRSMEFPTAKYGRGYERRVVDLFLQDVATIVDQYESAVADMGQRLADAEKEIERLQQRVIEGPRGDQVIQAVNIISSAQRTADATIAEADSYSARVMSEAQAAYDDARRRAALVEQEAEERVQRLSLSAQVHQDELDKQTAYLRTLRDATRTQMQKFLEGMLFHVAEEYGRAHPMAAEASAPSAGLASAEPPAESTSASANDSSVNNMAVATPA